MFAVNGAARSFFASIDPIWRDDPEVRINCYAARHTCATLMHLQIPSQ